MRRYKKIEVRAGKSKEQVLMDEPEIVRDFDTVKEAKEFAKYLVGSWAREMGLPEYNIQYAQVVADDVCLYDYFRKGKA